MTSTKLYRISALFLASLFFMAACAESSSSEKAEVKPIVHQTSDGRALVEGLTLGTMDLYSDPYTVPKSQFDQIFVETRTDEFGEYMVTKMSYPSIDSFKQRGPNLATFTSAVEFYTDFVSTQVLDSIAFDNYKNYKTWIKEVAPKYIANENFNDIVYAQDQKMKYYAVISNERETLSNSPYQDNNFPILIRDGGPRVFNKSFVELKAQSSGSGFYISGKGFATMVAEEQSLENWYREVFGTETLLRDLPNPKKKVYRQFIFDINLELKPDGDTWKISDFEAYYAGASDTRSRPSPPQMRNWRNAVLR